MAVVGESSKQKDNKHNIRFYGIFQKNQFRIMLAMCSCKIVDILKLLEYIRKGDESIDQ